MNPIKKCLCLLIAAALCGCAAAPATGQGAASPAAPAQAAPADASALGPLYPLSSGNGQGQYAVATMVDPQSHELYNLAVYVDYAAGRDVPLCAQPNCAHRDESCPAYLPEGTTRQYMILQDGRLLLQEVSSRVQGDGLTCESTIALCNADGSDPRTLAQDTGRFSRCYLAADAENLYFYAGEALPDGEYAKRLYRQSLESGECTLIAEMEPDFDCGGYYQGLYNRSFVFYYFHWPEIGTPDITIPEGITPEERDRLIQQQAEEADRLWDSATRSTSVYLLDVDTGSQTELMGWSWRNGEPDKTIGWFDGRLYWFDGGSPSGEEAAALPNPLHWITPDGSTGEVDVSWPQISIDGELSYVGLSDLVDGRLVVEAGYNLPGDVASTAVAIDLQTGGATQIALSYLSNAAMHPLRIAGHTEDSLLVQYGETYEDLTLRAPDGTLYSTSWCFPQYGLLSFADYFSGTPNYRQLHLEYSAYLQ